MNYNYARFSVDEYDLSEFPGPTVGEMIEDFSLSDYSGNHVQLSDFRGKWLVLETASITCNMYTRNIDKMTTLKRKFPEVEFRLIYVREAHPGQKLPQHGCMRSKMSAALRLRSDCGDSRKVLVDDIDGTVHQKLGAMPNMVYVIDPEGRVAYRHDWAVVDELDRVLATHQADGFGEHANTWQLRPFSWDTNKELFKTVGRGGGDAIVDLVKAIPFFMWEHMKADRSFKEQDRV